MGQRIRELTGGHRCEHGVQRATAQFRVYAGPVKTCTCCRSMYGGLQQQFQPQPDLCLGCGGVKDTPEQRRQFDLKMMNKSQENR